MGKTGTKEQGIGHKQTGLPAPMTGELDKPYQANVLRHFCKLIKAPSETVKINRKKISSGGISPEIWRNQEFHGLLNQADQGFLTFDGDLKVDWQFSAECLRIFGGNIAGVSIVQLLAQRRSAMREELTELFKRAFSVGQIMGQDILRQLPPVFRIGNKDVRVECKSIAKSHCDIETYRIMMILTDVTEVLRAAERISRLCYRDELTSLYNRAYIESMLPELEKRENLPLSVIMLDMNGLKLVNDVFGHRQGDLLLTALAKTLVKSCRATDILGRWGGDEFLVLLPKTGKEACAEICARFRRICEEMADFQLPLSAAMGTVTRDSDASSLDEMFIVAENRMYNNKLTESRNFRRRIIASMESMLDERCFENAGHIKRVRQLAADFAGYLGFDPGSPDIKLLNKLAALHDVGKVAIPKEILGKEGPLTETEWEIVKNHCEIGYRLAQSIGEPVLAKLILALRERWDGEGYPLGLKGEAIPLLVRLFALVDVYDVITHHRPYKKAMAKQVTLQEIAAGGGSKFDPELTEKFLQFMTAQQ